MRPSETFQMFMCGEDEDGEPIGYALCDCGSITVKVWNHAGYALAWKCVGCDQVFMEPVALHG